MVESKLTAQQQIALDVAQKNSRLEKGATELLGGEPQAPLELTAQQQIALDVGTHQPSSNKH